MPYIISATQQGNPPSAPTLAFVVSLVVSRLLQSHFYHWGKGGDAVKANSRKERQTNGEPVTYLTTIVDPNTLSHASQEMQEW